MSRLHAVIAGCAAIVVLNAPATAAVGTTCLCRSADGASFVKRTLRHHRWACDYLFGYLRGDPQNMRAQRPTSQTCNKEEIHQWKVYRCVSEGCTYPFARSSENAGLEEIRAAPNVRRP